MIVETWDFLCPIFFTNHEAGPCCKVKIKSCCKMGPSTIHRENVNVTKLLKYIVSSFYSFNNQYTIILECPWRRYNIPLCDDYGDIAVGSWLKNPERRAFLRTLYSNQNVRFGEAKHHLIKKCNKIKSICYAILHRKMTVSYHFSDFLAKKKFTLYPNPHSCPQHRP